MLEFFHESRILIAAQGLGTAQGALDRAMACVKSRERFGKKIAQFQVSQHTLAGMAKMVAGKTAVEVCDEAIQLLGGYGCMAEYEVERFARSAKICDL